MKWNDHAHQVRNDDLYPLRLFFENTLESPDLAKYLDRVYEDIEYVPGVSVTADRTIWTRTGKMDGVLVYFKLYDIDLKSSKSYINTRNLEGPTHVSANVTVTFQQYSTTTEVA